MKPSGIEPANFRLIAQYLRRDPLNKNVVRNNIISASKCRNKIKTYVSHQIFSLTRAKPPVFTMRVFVDENVSHYLICQSPISPLIPLSNIPLSLLLCLSNFLPFPFLSLSSCESNVGMIIIVWVVMTCEF